MNVLITSASRKVGLVRAFQEALRAEGGGRVIAVDASPLAAALYRADEQHLVPRSDDPVFLDVLLRLCRERSVSLLVPTRDEELPFFSRHRAEFSEAGTTVLVPDAETVDLCQDKIRFAEFCEAHDFAVPEIYDPHSVEYPAFVRPRRGKGGRSTFTVRSPAELEGALAHLAGDALIQEFLDAPEYTIDLFAAFDGTVISVVPRERLLVVGGESFVGRTVKDRILQDEALRLAEALRLTGHNTIQAFHDRGKAKFIEVNPRFGGGAALGFSAGALSPLFLVRLLRGKRVEPQLDRFKEGLYMLRFTDDIFLESEALSTERYSL